MHNNRVNIDRVKRQVLLKSSGYKPHSKVRIKTEKKFGLEDERVILCANCRSPVTVPKSIISVDGKHIHIFANPEGFEYEIGCFSSADGCLLLGEPTMEHTWFEDFSWSFAVCSNCHMHLGWFYEDGAESFFGLILDLLVDERSLSSSI